MSSNPFLGVLLHGIGGIAHGTFYAPLHRVKRWAWESSWLIQGVAAWVITPWVVAVAAGTDPVHVLSVSPLRSVVATYLFGVMWGFGSLTFGLSVRYLGMSLGTAVVLGYCTSFGTLVPPLVNGTFVSHLLTTSGGRTILSGVAVCLAGIGMCGYAGIRKEREVTEEQCKQGVKEFALGKGFLVATFSGIMSAGFAYGINAGKPIAEIAFQSGSPDILKNSPVFILIMAGGFTVNCIWCLILNFRHKTFLDYKTGPGVPLVLNYLYAAVAGLIWYTGFFFYGMGTTKMGQYDFSSWSIHLAFVIVFSTLCGIILKEWKGVGRKTIGLVYLAIFVLIFSTVITAIGNYIISRNADGAESAIFSFSASRNVVGTFCIREPWNTV